MKFKLKKAVVGSIMGVVCGGSGNTNDSSIYNSAKITISNSVERLKHNLIWLSLRLYVDTITTASCDMIHDDIHRKNKRK